MSMTEPELLAWLETHCVVCEIPLEPCTCGKLHERSCYELGDFDGCFARQKAANPEVRYMHELTDAQWERLTMTGDQQQARGLIRAKGEV